MRTKKPLKTKTGSPIEALVQSDDPIKPRGPRPGFITPKPAKELPSPPWTILRYRTARAESNVMKRNILNSEVLMPLKKARELLTAREEMVKWTKFSLESIEDYNALMANPDWLIPDKGKQLERLMTRLQSRLTSLKRTLE